MTQTQLLASGFSDSVPAPHPLVARYLAHVRVEKRLAQRTLELYTLDLQKLQANAALAGVALTEVHNSQLRRWVAQMHGAGRSGRGIALILSGWRGFYRWLGREGLVSANPVQDRSEEHTSELQSQSNLVCRL